MAAAASARRPHPEDAGRLLGVRVDGDRIIRPDGMAAAVVVSGSLDIGALDAAAVAAVTAGLGRLLRALDWPLQIVVQSRCWLDPPPAAAGATGPPTGLAARLLDAETAFGVARLARATVMRRRILFVPTAPGADPEVLDRAVAGVDACLAAAGVGARRLGGGEIGALIAEASTGRGAEPAGDGVRLGGLTPPPPALHEVPGWARCGAVLVRAIRLRRLPGVGVSTGWLAPLLRAPVESDVSIHVRPVAAVDAIGRLQRRLRGLRADQLVELDREGLGDAAVEAGVEAALDLRWRLVRNTAVPLTLAITAVARAPDRARLDAGSDALRAAFAACLVQAEPAHLEHLEAAGSTWPVGIERGTLPKLVDSAAAATCAPWVETVVDDPGGYPLGRAAETETPVRLDPFDVREHSNANIAVLAASGRGKSYAISGLLLAAAARGVAAVVVDPEGEYASLIGALDGDYLVLRPGCGASLNLFDAAGATAGAERRGELAGAAVALAAVLCGGRLDDVERAAVDAATETALARAEQEGRPPVLGDCLGALGGRAPRVATVLGRFCTGSLGELFNRPTSVRLDRALVGLSLRDLRDELVPAATLIVAEWLWALVRRDRRRRHIVVDEVGLLCAHPPLRTLLAQLARRCRKYDASLVIATQNAGDLLASEDGRVMATNPAIALLGGHHGAETALMQRAYALTDAQRAQLEAAGRGDFLLLAGRRRLAVHIELPPLQHALITGATAPAEG